MTGDAAMSGGQERRGAPLPASSWAGAAAFSGGARVYREEVDGDDHGVEVAGGEHRLHGTCPTPLPFLERFVSF
jgi:hypothetical protein